MSRKMRWRLFELVWLAVPVIIYFCFLHSPKMQRAFGNWAARPMINADKQIMRDAARREAAPTPPAPAAPAPGSRNPDGSYVPVVLGAGR